MLAAVLSEQEGEEICKSFFSFFFFFPIRQRNSVCTAASSPLPQNRGPYIPTLTNTVHIHLDLVLDVVIVESILISVDDKAPLRSIHYLVRHPFKFWGLELDLGARLKFLDSSPVDTMPAEHFLSLPARL